MKKLMAAVMAVAMVLVGAAAMAATQTANFNVTANIPSSCTINAAALAFGAYSEAANSDAQADITYNCTNGTSLHVYVGNGADQRTVSNGTDTLAFEIYSDNGRSTAFAVDASGGASTSTGVNQTVTMYGRMASGQTGKTAGNYTRQLTATIDY